MTVAAFMELALYHPQHGYYASRRQRSGRAGDFYTSVDAGPFFGELLAVQFAEMARLVTDGVSAPFDLVEAAAGNGRLMRDVLDALHADAAEVYGRTRVHLVERSSEARRVQAGTLGTHAGMLSTSSDTLPSGLSGVIFANELLDAFPVHLVVVRGGTLREIYVDLDGERLVEREAPVSDPAIEREYAAGPPLGEGTRAEINLSAGAWLREAASRLERGFVLLVDYGADAAALRSPARAEGTLRAFAAHRVSADWLAAPGEQDLTSHVDFTAVSRAAAAAGLEPLGLVDQTRFLLALGAIERLQRDETRLSPVAALRRRLAAKTLLVPGGIGSTHHVLLLGQRMGHPDLAGLRWTDQDGPDRTFS